MVDTTLDVLTIIIPHHDQSEKLSCLLVDLTHIRNVIIVKGGTYAENCNRGFLLVDTPYVCFLNDDTRIIEVNFFQEILHQFLTFDIFGCQAVPHFNGFQIINGKFVHARENSLEPAYPSGCCIFLKSELFRTLDGFSTEYRNGAEDVDLYLRAQSLGLSIGIANQRIFHHEAASAGRFDYFDENRKIFNQRWRGVCEL